MMTRFLSLFVLVFSLISSLALHAEAQVANRLNHRRFVDLRDLHTYKTELSGTSNQLMKAFETRPAEFVDNANISFFRSGPIGPAGTTPENSDVFQITEPFEQKTHKETILSAQFESIFEEDADRIFRGRLLLFIHDSTHPSGFGSNGYYFRRVTVRVDWTTKNEAGEPLIQVLGFEGDIPLANTQFALSIDLLARKAILNDSANGIIKVFPLGVGAFDVRTAPGMDRAVQLMTREFYGGTLKRSLGDSSSNNTRTRTYPSYYRGRPFLAIFDSTGTYQQVGMHYQIDGWGLTRGFVSHGCIRVRDVDLYQLDAILNEFPDIKNGIRKVPTEVRNFLPEWRSVDHPMPKEDAWSNIVTYSDAPTTEKIQCPQKNPYTVRWYGGSLHTVADGDCLTMVVRRNQSVNDVVGYLGERREGDMFILPNTYIGNQEHVPVALKAGRQSTGWVSDGGEENRQRREQNILGQIFSIPGKIIGAGINAISPPKRVQNRPAPVSTENAIADQVMMLGQYADLKSKNCIPGAELKPKDICAAYDRLILSTRQEIERLRSGQR